MTDAVRVTINILLVGVFVVLLNFYKCSDNLEINKHRVIGFIVTCLISAFRMSIIEQAIFVMIVFNAYTDMFNMQIYLMVVLIQTLVAIIYTVFNYNNGGIGIEYIVEAVLIYMFLFIIRAYCIGDALMLIDVALVISKRWQNSIVIEIVLMIAIAVFLIRWVLYRMQNKKEHKRRIDFTFGIAIAYLTVCFIA